MPTHQRKMKRAKLQKKGLLHEKISQYTKPDITGTLKAGISYAASEISSLFSTTAGIFRQLPDNLSKLADAIKEDPGVVISHTLIGAMGGLALGPMNSINGEAEQKKIYGYTLSKLAEQNAGCDYIKTLRQNAQPLHNILCHHNTTLENKLSLAASNTASQTVPIMPYVIEGMKYGFVLGGTAGFLSGAYQALTNSHKRKFNSDYPKHAITVLIHAYKTDYQATVHDISQGIGRHISYYPLPVIGCGLLYGTFMSPESGLLASGFLLCGGLAAGIRDGAYQVVKQKRQQAPVYIQSHENRLNEMKYTTLRQQDKNLFSANNPTLFNKIGSRSLRDGKLPDFLQVAAVTAGSFLLLESLDTPFSSNLTTSFNITFLMMLKHGLTLSVPDATRDFTSIAFFLGILGTLGGVELSNANSPTKISTCMASLTLGMLSLLSDFYKLHTSYFREIETTERDNHRFLRR